MNNINQKPTTASVANADYAFLSQSSAVKRVTIANLIEFIKSMIVADVTISQDEVDELWDEEEEE